MALSLGCNVVRENISVLESGVARIKPEFIISDHERKLTVECIAEEDKQKFGILDKLIEGDPEETSNMSDDSPACKKLRLSKQEKKKLRGQNKARPPPFKFEREKNLCRALVDIGEEEVEPKCGNEKCAFIHKVNEYLAIKPPDIGPVCYIYSLRGHCERGITCRFSSQHINSAGRNMTNTALYEKYQARGSTTINMLTKDLQQNLRKRHYSFTTSQNIIDKVDAGNAKPHEQKQTIEAKDKLPGKEECLKMSASPPEQITEVKVDVSLGGESVTKAEIPTEQTKVKSLDENLKLSEFSEGLSLNTRNISKEKELLSFMKGEKKLGPVSDQDIVSVKPREKVVIDWKDKLYLSPLTTVGNLPFRRICKEFGVDITCGEMAMASTILRGLPQEWALVKRHVSEDLFGVQLCGNNPYVMTKCAQLLEEQTDINFVDVNLGCPIELVYRHGEGSGLLRRDKALASVIQCMSQVLSIPLTVKTRTGVYMDKNIAHNLVPKFRNWGVSLITIHGRSREQRYTKSADWPYVEQCAKLSVPVPLFLNGDILSFEDYERARRECPTVAGAMIGRGALIKPWIFTEIKERRHWDITSLERLDILKKYVNYGLEHWGSDTKGVENTRKFLLEWLSFLHRYIPIGLLECPPQRINERPPYYSGRDELETLMASTNCADWIKISEMLLGPVPDKFNFLPKHKASSWK